ncbi:MAG: alpha/beta hydrolase, partial [Anaerolineaceae bacterium]|nr:alpha/beta hydrolase [Anaerolineaceae bacterium]
MQLPDSKCHALFSARRRSLTAVLYNSPHPHHFARAAVPGGETIRLAFAIIRSTSETPQPDPLVIETGGPGISTLTSAPWLVSMPDLRVHRDIVLIEQRGTRYSEPNLYCDKIIEAVKENLTSGVIDNEKATQLENALAACRGRLTAQGIHLSAYDSLENAADIPMVLSALGYDSYNFYSISYATRLAQHLMCDHPERLRSVIIDAPVPFSVDYTARAPESVARAFKQLFESCSDDPLCDDAYPDLESVFYDLVDAYDETPIRVHFEEPEAVDIEVSGQTLVWMLYQH